MLKLCIYACLALSAVGHSAGTSALQPYALGSCGGQSKAGLPPRVQPGLGLDADTADRSKVAPNGVTDRPHGSAFQGCGVAQSDRESIRRGEFMTRGDVVLTRSAAPLADQSAHPADIGAGEAVASSTVDLAASPIVGRVCLLKQFSRSSFHIDTPLLLCFGAIYDRNYIVSLDQLSCQAKKAPVPKIFEEKAKGTNV